MTEKEYVQKVNVNINKLKKVFRNFFVPSDDFDKDNTIIFSEIEENVLLHVQSILLVNQYVNEIIKKTFEKYKIKDISKLCDVTEYLQLLYTTILTDVYSYHYPNSWV
jgi:hypothetical protein